MTRPAKRTPAAAGKLTEIVTMAESGAERVVDSPNEQTHARVDPMYDQPHTRRQRRNVAQSLVVAANRKVPAYIPATPSPPTR